MLLKDALVLLASRREHSIFELKEKLKKHSDSVEDIASVINWACDQGLVDEERFVESRVMYRWYRGYGPLKVMSELRMHQIKNELITACMNGYDWQASLSKSQLKCRHDVGTEAWKRVMLSRGFRYDDVLLWLKNNT